MKCRGGLGAWGIEHGAKLLDENHLDLSGRISLDLDKQILYETSMATIAT